MNSFSVILLFYIGMHSALNNINSITICTLILLVHVFVTRNSKSVNTWLNKIFDKT